MKTFYRDLRVGVLGGGQLGRMLIQAAMELNVHISVLDPDPQAPCRPYAHEFYTGSLSDYDTVMQFGSRCDLLTIEIEHVNTEALAALKAAGKIVYPDPAHIAMIQDKRLQKTFLQSRSLPTAPFVLVENREEVARHPARFPVVQKLARAGYDGRGVQVLRSEAQLSQAFDAPGLLEEFVPFEKEIAVIVARNPQGEMAVFPPVEMVFHPEQNVVEYLFAPALLSAEQAAAASELARQVVKELEYTGVMAVEMFLTREGHFLINELAPRPHNSGHHSIRANASSQYEQHLRAILGLPLGDTRPLCAAAMVNLLGEAGYTGPVLYEGIEKALAMPGVFPHFYGKAETRPFRKMGHVIILGEHPDELRERVHALRACLRVVS